MWGNESGRQRHGEFVQPKFFIISVLFVSYSKSVLSYLLSIFRKESLQQLSMEMSADNPAVQDFASLYAQLQKQSMMVGLKEVFGIAAAVGIVTIFGLCFSDLRGKFKGAFPKLPSLWRMVKYDKRY